MAGVYRPRYPERTVLYRVMFHHFERFLTEYEGRFEREYGYFRSVVKEVVERYLDCGNPSRIDDSRLEELFCREVLDFLIRRELLSPEWAERLLSWRHSGISVHSRVRATTKPEA
jgi:hypothetical protein